MSHRRRDENAITETMILEQSGTHNIVLAGFMGTGKTTAGKALAERLGWEFVDTDRVIEVRAGKSVAAIFESEGEPAFRDMETALARALVHHRHCVVATGGGFMVRPENREAAAMAGPLFLLTAAPEEIVARIGQSRRRPLMAGEDPMTRVRELLEKRKDAYGAIPNKIPTDGRTPEEVADAIVERLLQE